MNELKTASIETRIILLIAFKLYALYVEYFVEKYPSYVLAHIE